MMVNDIQVGIVEKHLSTIDPPAFIESTHER